MAGMNSQVHIFLDTFTHENLRREAEKLDITVSELVRRKIEKEPTSEEIILVRKLRNLLRKKNTK